MARRYDYAMQKHGRRKKVKAPGKALNFQTLSLLNDSKESEYEASWRRGLFSTGETNENKAEAVGVDEDLPLTVHAVGIGEQNPNQIGQEFSGITDRISKVKEHTIDSLKDDITLSINPLALYHKCRSLIGYASHYLFGCRQ